MSTAQDPQAADAGKAARDAEERKHRLQLLGIAVPAITTLLVAFLNSDKISCSAAQPEQSRANPRVFYRKHMERLGRGDLGGYSADFASPVRCYYNMPGLTPADIRKRRQEQRERMRSVLIPGDEDKLKVLALPGGNIGVWDVDASVENDGKPTPTERYVILSPRGDTFRIIAEADLHAHKCLPEFPQ